MNMQTVPPGSGYQPPELNTTQQKAMRIIKGSAPFEDRFNPNHDELVALIKTLRSMGCRIVFTTGVWDLFHIGHAEYIQRGKEETIKLYPDAEHVIVVVGVDTDTLTKKRKGPDRPVVPQDERIRVLAHLRSVDILALQTENDQLFRLVPHDVRVISQSTKDLPDLKNMKCQCEHVVNLPPQAETSTTARIRRLSLDGAISVLVSIERRLSRVLEEVRSEIEKPK